MVRQVYARCGSVKFCIMIKPYPILIFIITILLVAYSKYVPLPIHFNSSNHSLGSLLIGCGIVLLIYTQLLFQKHKTTIHPFKKPTRLIKSSVFKYSRNPIYLGFLIILTGTTFFATNILSILLVVIYVLSMNILIIDREEKLLTNIFKDQYLKYKKITPRWIFIV